MLEIKYIRKNLPVVERSLNARGASVALQSLLAADETHRNILQELEKLRHRRNTVSDEIAVLKKAGENASTQVADMRDVSAQIKALDQQRLQAATEIETILLEIPNVPHESVPVGTGESDNETIKTHGVPPEFDFKPRAHWDIGKHLGILDFDRAARITGARFPLYFGAGARLERALINFMLDTHTKDHGYREVLPPFIINRDALTHTGQLPKFAEDLFKLEKWDYFLTPTAEVPVTNIHQNEVIPENELPISYAAYTPCFRSEAGSYGKDTRGLIRQHQFNKVELVHFTKPETSYAQLEALLSHAETILKKLGLSYRVVTLCTGDLGFSAAKTYDIEVWMPAQNAYREISSCSNFEDFQARRGRIRFKRDGQKGTELVHTLNGSGLAVGRTVAAILENFQQPDGSVLLPAAIQPYMGQMESITR